MFDLLISVALFFVTFVLAYMGFHVSLHPADSERSKRRWKAWFVVCGVAALGLVVWQGIRTKASQQESTNQMETLRGQVTNAKQETESVHKDLQAESTRRQQAEKDLAIIVQNAAQATRTGVAADIRSAPLKVQSTGVIVNQKKLNALAQFITRGLTIRQSVPLKDSPTESVEPWLATIQDWWNEVYGFLEKNCTKRALVLAQDLTRMMGVRYPKLHSDERVQQAMQNSDRLVGNLTELLKRPELCQ